MGKIDTKKMVTLNPPSETLYLTQLYPDNEEELFEQIEKHLFCKIVKIEWKKQKTTQVTHGSQNGSFSGYNKGKSGRNSTKKSTKDFK